MRLVVNLQLRIFIPCVQLVRSYATTDGWGNWMLANVDWYLLPVVNPDGYEYSMTTVSVHKLGVKGAIISKIKHATNIKQVLRDLHNCCTTVAALISIFVLACNQ